MTVTEIRQILESPYDRKVWKNFIQTQFTNNKLNAEDRAILLSDKTLSKQCLSLGNYEINEYTNIGIFEVELNEKVNIARNRVALRNLIKDITKQVAGAMVVFVQGDKWRFSYISKRKVKNAANEIEDKQTAPKRYTYLFGKNEKALTAAIRFDKLIQKQKENIFQFLSLDDFEEAFSVEKLSKEFFKNYKEIYEDFVQFLTGKRYGKKGNKYVEQVIHEPNWQLTSIFSKDEKQARDFCKRIMGRIVFLYFIQKKGWLAVKQGKKWGEGNQDYLFDLFRKSKYKDDFYARELVPLFFTRLNNEDSENKAREERFPYLNGGLFDDSHDRKYNKLFLPEEIFARLFETFNNYNFTVYEDAPDEHTVAVDPEMLGHIFENLLEDNKDKGAFYTPKEIVHYMCKESLKAYLYAHPELHTDENQIAKSAIDKLIQQQELNEDEKQFAEKQAYKIIDALEQVKICDPAIGSGAFPMGLLQEIFNAQIYLQELKGFKKGVTDADIKKHIIEESIYGVDIDAGAVDIARLRFWLSLVVDEQEPQPLPNLDFKIVCANTLIPLGKLTGNDMEAKASLAVKELEKIRHDFFNVSSEEKLHIERQFKKVQTDLLSLRELTTKENYDVYTKLYEFNPFDGQSCSWFDPWWMFGIKEGFDIVIGNPPYDVYEGTKKDEIEILSKIPLYDKAKGGKLNAYKLFIAKSMDILKKGGIFCQIFQNSFLADNSATKIRKFILESNTILKIDSFPERDDVNKRVFESAKMSVCILVCQKIETTNKPFLLTVWETKDVIRNTITLSLADIFVFDDKNLVIPTITKEELNLVSILRKNVKTKFKDYSRCIEGELNMTFHKEYFTNNKSNPLIVKGAQVQRYYITDKPSQGEVQYLDTTKYFRDYGKTEKANHHKNNRIALQGITGANDKIRLVMSLLPAGVFCANSCNYIIINQSFKKTLDINYLLAISNSTLINWIFKKSSTNSNVNCYEIDNLPLAICENKIQLHFSCITKYLHYLYGTSKDVLTHTANKRIASHLEDILNMMVYELYFEQHMKENGIDVLHFINEKLSATKTENSIIKEIEDFYMWYQKPENPVRQRMQLIETRSQDIIALINKRL